MIQRQGNHRGQILHQIGFSQSLDEKPHLFFPILRPTDQLARLGIERNLQLLPSKALSCIVALGTDRELPLRAGVPEPTSPSGVRVDALKVEHNLFPLWAVGPARVGGLWVSLQQRPVCQRRGGKVVIEKMSSFRQAHIQGGPIGECLLGYGLLIQRLMVALNEIMLGRWRIFNEADLNTQADQPEMKRGGKGRWAGVIIEDAVVVQAEALRQAILQERAPQGQLVVLGVRMRGVQTGKTLHFEPTTHVDDVKDGDLPDSRDIDRALRIHFSFFVHRFYVLLRWLKQLGVPFVRSRVAFLLQKRCDA